MKAVILAGGRGTRGRPYTDYFPKAMIPIGGTPLIRYIVGYLDSYPFVNEIIVISDFRGLGAQIRNYLSGQKTSGKLRFVQDSQSGTGGDLLHASGLLRGSKEFVLWFVDNFCAIDLRAMKERFDSEDSVACIATRSRRREETGFARVVGGKVVEFREKPTVRLQMEECLGIYMLDTRILGMIRRRSKMGGGGNGNGGGGDGINLSYDILEELSKKAAVSAYDIGGREWLDVESPVTVDRNRRQVNKIIRQMGL